MQLQLEMISRRNRIRLRNQLNLLDVNSYFISVLQVARLLRGPEGRHHLRGYGGLHWRSEWIIRPHQGSS